MKATMNSIFLFIFLTRILSSKIVIPLIHRKTSLKEKYRSTIISHIEESNSVDEGKLFNLN